MEQNSRQTLICVAMACEGNSDLMQLLENDQASPKIHYSLHIMQPHTDNVFLKNPTKPNYQLAMDAVN